MLDVKFLICIIRDILSTKQYTISEIAQFADIPKDVIHEILQGRNTDPTFLVMKRILKLHTIVRAKLYDEILKEVSSWPEIKMESQS